MVKEYLEKTRDEFYDSRQSLIEKLTTAENHYKENIKLIQMLEDSSDENYEAFTPREVNSYNKNKIREIKEELDADISVDSFLQTVEYDYPKFHLILHCFLCSLKNDTLHLLEHESARWLSADELESVEWLPADLSIVRNLKQ